MVDNAFRLSRDFVRTVAEWYSDDQAIGLLAFEDAAKRNPNERPPVARRPAIPKGRLVKHIRSLLEEAFWASLRTEEGRRNAFALEYGPPGENEGLHKDPIMFAEPLPFTSAILAKIAPALHSTQIIGVWPRESAKGKGELAIWGFARRLAGSSLSLKTVEPGKIILSFGDYQKP